MVTNRITFKTSREGDKENINHLTSFSEEDIFLNENGYNLSEYLFPEDNDEQSRVSVIQAMKSYRFLGKIIITHFNKLRETYKELYFHLKTKKEIELPKTPLLLKIKKKI